jgi:type IV secretory pathway VirB4 component
MESLHSKQLTRADSTGSSTQKYVDVEEVRDGVIILKNGSLRAVLMVSSINFDLKSTEEQDTIITQYQNFLNSLDFPIQIVISSRRINVAPYLEFLKQREKQTTNELLAMQLVEYGNFIKNMAESSNIMTKYFYVVVPFYPVENVNKGLFEKMFGSSNQKTAANRKHELLNTYKSQLWQRLDQISAGLGGTGVKVTTLNTEELIELLYNSYNPSMHNNAVIKGMERVELS